MVPTGDDLCECVVTKYANSQTLLDDSLRKSIGRNVAKKTFQNSSTKSTGQIRSNPDIRPLPESCHAPLCRQACKLRPLGCGIQIDLRPLSCSFTRTQRRGHWSGFSVIRFQKKTEPHRHDAGQPAPE